jgi:SAM-dependent methyltransferase
VFRRYNPAITWIGVELESSEYARPVNCSNVVFYDGTRLPFASGSVPAVFSNQVFEHVRHPEELLREVCRVLKPGGVLVGKTSQLEPYHAHSLWNFTPYGFRVIVEAAGMRLEEVRPGIDGIALVTRAATRESFSDTWWSASPYNKDVDEWGRAVGRPARILNGRKLSVCGQFGFRVRKPIAGQVVG